MNRPLKKEEIRAELALELGKSHREKYEHLLKLPEELNNECDDIRINHILRMIATVDAMIGMNVTALANLTDIKYRTAVLTRETDQIEEENRKLQKEIQELHKAINRQEKRDL